MLWIQLIYSAIVGIVQGISEWLPISSKTQVLITSMYLMHLTFQQAYTFGLFMEIGTILAAVIYFRRELLTLLKAIVGKSGVQGRSLLVYVLTATIVTGAIGAPLYLFADNITGLSVGIPMLIIGLVLIGDAFFIRHSRKKHSQKPNTRKFSSLRFREYVFVGIAQGIAALPGVSRSGITTSLLLLMNVEPDEAFRLSFLIGIFAAAGAFALTVMVSHANVTAAMVQIGTTGLLVAMAVSTVVSLFLIDFLIKVAGRSRIVYLTAALGIIAIASGVLVLSYGMLHIPVAG